MTIEEKRNAPMIGLLVLTTFFAAAGGILYEIYLGAFGSYLFGDSVKIFSLTMGVYMFSMGVGAFSIKSNIEKPHRKFLALEYALILIHLLSPFVVWIFFAEGIGAGVAFWFCLFLSGLLVGAEIPLLLAVARKKEGTSDKRINQVLAADYVGALAASLAFGFYLLPKLGLIGTAAVAALSEFISIAFFFVLLYRNHFNESRTYYCLMLLLAIPLFVANILILSKADTLQKYLENKWIKTYVGDAKVLHSEWSRFAYITLVDYKNPYTDTREISLLLDRQFQWHTGKDLEQYHELLTIPGSEAFKVHNNRDPKSALIIGGGDGFAASRLKRYYQVEKILLIDIDPRIVDLAKEVPRWRDEGGKIFDDPSIQVVHADAFSYIRDQSPVEAFDLIVMDLPDPRSPGLSRFYTSYFFSNLKKWMNKNSVISIQASSEPHRELGRRDYVCKIEHALRDVGLNVKTLTGNELDFYIVASNFDLQFPEKQKDSLPGQILSDGQHLSWFLTDPFDQFGPACAKISRNTLLHPTLLDN